MYYSLIYTYTHAHTNTYQKWCNKVRLSLGELSVANLASMPLSIKTILPQRDAGNSLSEREKRPFFSRDRQMGKQIRSSEQQTGESLEFPHISATD